MLRGMVGGMTVLYWEYILHLSLHHVDGAGSDDAVLDVVLSCLDGTEVLGTLHFSQDLCM